jgi:predicted nucleotidyltransferase
VDLEADANDAVRAVLGGEPGVAAAYVFGSAARGQRTPLSDIDVAVLPDPGLDEDARRHLQRRLILELGRRLAGVPVDVRFLDELPIAIAGRVLAEGVRIVDTDPALRVRAEVSIRMRYHDFQSFERVGTEEGLAGLRRRLADG